MAAEWFSSSATAGLYDDDETCFCHGVEYRLLRLCHDAPSWFPCDCCGKWRSVRTRFHKKE